MASLDAPNDPLTAASILEKKKIWSQGGWRISFQSRCLYFFRFLTSASSSALILALRGPVTTIFCCNDTCPMWLRWDKIWRLLAWPGAGGDPGVQNVYDCMHLWFEGGCFNPKERGCNGRFVIPSG